MTSAITGPIDLPGQRTQYLQYRSYRSLPTLGDLLPGVSRLTIRWWYGQDGKESLRGSSPRVWDFVPDSRAHLQLDCASHSCVDGGHDLSGIVGNLVEVGDTALQGALMCSGWRQGVDQRLVRCECLLQYTVRIEYQ